MSDEDYALFEAHPQATIGGCIKIEVFESKETGLRGMLVQTDEPLCSLHVVLATEADTNDWSHKDDGLPHTLEHAIFLGSELYPFKGILDKLANRSLADGTNAWTATDHTCYTLTTAGEEGCLNLLPIYADHILYPTLTDSCFHTEVHHVTAEGEDKGVVYCEMQGRENDSSSLVDRAVLDLLYPTGGYSAETGGKMANLRTLTNAQVARYHREVYTPSNTLFVASGIIDRAAFVAALAVVERRVRAKPAVPPMTRPWSGPVAPMDEAADGVIAAAAGASSGGGEPKVVEFPSEDESTGCVSMAWRGPPYDDGAAWTRLQLLWAYLTDSAVAPLQKEFVECDEPLCADIGPAEDIFSQGYHQVWFHDGETETLGEIPRRLMNALQDAHDAFDIERIGLVIRRKKRRLLARLENSPTDSIVDPVIRHFLYGPRAVGGAAETDALVRKADRMAELTAAEALGADDWKALLRTYMLERPCAAVVGTPSAALAEKIPAEVEARTKQQKEELGEEKCAALAATLEAAIAHNERPIPEEALRSVPVPAISKVKSVPIATIRGGGATPLAAVPAIGSVVPPETVASLVDALTASRAAAGAAADGLWVEWSHIESAFVNVTVLLDTRPLTPAQRLYLPLLLDLAFKAPATLDDGTALSKDDFVEAIQDETVGYSADYGIGGRAGDQTIALYLQVEASRGLGAALTWLRRALFLTKYNADDIKIAAKNLSAAIPGEIRDGPGIARAIRDEIVYEEGKANSVAGNAMRQSAFLDGLLAALGGGGDDDDADGPDDGDGDVAVECQPVEEEEDAATAAGAARVETELSALRDALVRHPAVLRVYVAADLARMTSGRRPTRGRTPSSLRR